jgi:hypothetical protein
MHTVLAFRGRLSFSHCFLKKIRFATALVVNFKKNPSFDFFVDVVTICAMNDLIFGLKLWILFSKQNNNIHFMP